MLTGAWSVAGSRDPTTTMAVPCTAFLPEDGTSYKTGRSRLASRDMLGNELWAVHDSKT